MKSTGATLAPVASNGRPSRARGAWRALVTFALALLVVPGASGAPSYGPSVMLFDDPNGSGTAPDALSDDGRYVAYAVGIGPTYILDRQTGTSQQATVPVASGSLALSGLSLSGSGRVVAFSSNNPGVFVPGAPNGEVQVLVRDVDAGTTVVASRAGPHGTGAYGDRGSSGMALSSDGSVVAFASAATNLVSPDGNACTEEEEDIFVPANCTDVFVRDFSSGSLEKVSVPDPSTSATEANGHSFGVHLSSTGRYVAFYSEAPNLVVGDTNGQWDMFLRDRVAGTTERVSVTTEEEQLAAGARAMSSPSGSSISADGRFVVFESTSTELAPDGNGLTTQLFLRDRQLGETVRITSDALGGTLPSISADGSHVLYQALADWQAYVWSRGDAETVLVSSAADGNPANDLAYPRGISGDGSVVLFMSRASNLGTPVGPDGYATEVFLRGPAPAFTDVDGDGVDDSIDTGTGSFADTSMSPPTIGQIVSTNGLAVRIEDASEAGAGVKVIVGAGSGEAVISVCGGVTIRLASDSEATVTCGSVTLEVTSGGPAVVVLGSGVTVVSVPQGAKIKVTQNLGGSFGVENLGSVPVTIAVDGIPTAVEAGASKVVRAWHFGGFSHPVDAAPILNSVKAGAAVPLKWRLTDGQGNPVTSLALSADAISVENYSCGLATTSDAIEELAAGSSGLQNLGDGYYQLNWKTNKAWGGSCKTMRLDLGEGITRNALFKFTK